MRVPHVGVSHGGGGGGRGRDWETLTFSDFACDAERVARMAGCFYKKREVGAILDWAFIGINMGCTIQMLMS